MYVAMSVDKTGISCTQTSALDEDNVHASKVTKIKTIFRKMRISKIQVCVNFLRKKPQYFLSRSQTLLSGTIRGCGRCSDECCGPASGRFFLHQKYFWQGQWQMYPFSTTQIFHKSWRPLESWWSCDEWRLWSCSVASIAVERCPSPLLYTLPSNCQITNLLCPSFFHEVFCLISLC